MAPFLEVVDLFARWTHLIAAIMWIGNSLLWNWIDRNLVARAEGARTQTPEPVGAIWLLHSGAFYYMEKTLLAGAPFPRPLHWFKWQAYTTWWSGLALLLTVYWFGGRAALTDASVSALTQGGAVALAIGLILASGFVYEFAHRAIAPCAPRAATFLWIAGLSAIAGVFLQYFQARAAFVHVGAMLGTIMAANVVFTIMPAQRELVALVAAGGSPATASAASARAKRVSIDNNYLVFPVIALMLSAHFPSLYASPNAGAVLALLVATGVGVRHLLNIRYTFGAWHPALGATLVAGFVGLVATVNAGREAPRAAAADTSGPVAFADVRHVIDRRCAVCHAAEPADLSFGPIPGGVAFDTPEQIVAFAARIQERAIATRTMPPANKTNLTDAERALIARWIAEGARRVP